MRSELLPPLIVVDANQQFFPYLDAKAFMVDKPKQYYRSNYDTFLRAPIQFKGIYGELNVITVPKKNVELYRHAQKPLGLELPPEGKEIPAPKIPLQLHLEFNVNTLRDYTILQLFYLDIQLGEENYFFDCRGDEEEEYAIRTLRGNNPIHLATRTLIDPDETIQLVALPQDLAKLQPTRAIFYEYDGGDDQDEPITPTEPRILVPA